MKGNGSVELRFEGRCWFIRKATYKEILCSRTWAKMGRHEAMQCAQEIQFGTGVSESVRFEEDR